MSNHLPFRPAESAVSRGVVLLHGLGAEPNSWAPVSRHFDPDITLSTPQICTLDGSLRFTMKGAVAATRSALSQLDATHRVLAGHSLGAVVALATAGTDAPIDHLVLISGFAKAPRRLLATQAAAFRVAPQRLLGDAVERDALIEPMRELRSLDLRAHAARLDVPTTVVCGARDWLNRRQATELARIIPGANLQLLQGVGHMAPAQAGDRLAELITTPFLEST